MPRLWRPFTVKHCCTVDDHAVLGNLNLSRCRPTRSELSKKVVERPSFRRLSNSDLSSSSSARFAEDFVHSCRAGMHVFQLSELRAITHDFSSNFLLGEGGFGTVHKGYMDDKMRPGLKAQAVAVKLLDIEGLQGHREWLVSLLHFFASPWLAVELSSSRRLRLIMDPKLAGHYSVKAARVTAGLALQCTSLTPKDRPQMKVVVETLEGLQDLKDMAVNSSARLAAPVASKHASASAKSKLEGFTTARRKTV